MKSVYFLAFLLFVTSLIYAQIPVKPDTIVPFIIKPDKVKEGKKQLKSDSVNSNPIKVTFNNFTIKRKYGDLTEDDPLFNQRYPIRKPIAGVLGAVITTWMVDRIILNFDYSRINVTTWKSNLTNGWEWDFDRFGMNFILHPYSGTLTYNAGRSNGYNYFQSATFALAGSFMWELFGENTRPSYNDIVNTPINGTFLGEILYRISSNMLDDRTRGKERVFREITAGIINPMRGINRLLQGKTFRVTNKEVYQKEPLNISLYAGLHLINDGIEPDFLTGSISEMVNIQLDYGNPFIIRSRKPFDFFKLRAEFDFGVGNKKLSNVTGYGILYGKNLNFKRNTVFMGIFQYSEYWDNKTFELGVIGFGGGVFSLIQIGKKTNLFTNIHFAVIPLAGNSTHLGPDTSDVRDYNFGEGFGTKIESTLILGKYATASLIFYYYMIHTNVGLTGNNFIGILKPRITIRVYKNISVGFENYIYYNNRYLSDYPAIHLVRTEQKVFLLIFLEDEHRKGHYN